MQRLAIFALLVALATSAPTSEITSNDIDTSAAENDTLVIDATFFDKRNRVLTAEHEIVELLFPTNDLNFNDDEEDDEKIIFFVEADIVDGKKDYKGMSVFKNGTLTKILETGTSAATGEKKELYIGATDGLYTYNAEQNTAKKYGTINDNIIGIAKANSTDTIYILNNKNELYKVTEEGTKKELIDARMVEQFVLDNADNIYYYCDEKKVHVITESGKILVEGLPSDRSYIKLITPPFIFEESAVIVVDNKSFIINPNGTVTYTDVILEVKPSAYSLEAALLQHYAYEKSIYEYNFLSLMMGEELGELRSFLQTFENEVSEIATRSLSNA